MADHIARYMADHYGYFKRMTDYVSKKKEDGFLSESLRIQTFYDPDSNSASIKFDCSKMSDLSQITRILEAIYDCFNSYDRSDKIELGKKYTVTVTSDDLTSYVITTYQPKEEPITDRFSTSDFSRWFFIRSWTDTDIDARFTEYIGTPKDMIRVAKALQRANLVPLVDDHSDDRLLRREYLLRSQKRFSILVDHDEGVYTLSQYTSDYFSKHDLNDLI